MPSKPTKDLEAKLEPKSDGPARRMGEPGAPAWHAILDGAEEMLRDQGHAALNAKSIAEHTGITRQLIYYYFRDMDDLLFELFNRIANRMLGKLRDALEAPNPLAETWDAGLNTLDQTLVWEFLALGNRNEKIRRGFIDYADVARTIQVSALEKVLGDHPLPRVEIPLEALAIIATWAALGLRREASLGITRGHQELEQMITDILAQANVPQSD